MNTTLRLAMLIGCLFLTTSVLAQDDLQLSSGETLSGEFVGLKGGKVKFKSTDLGEQEIPLEKVKGLETTKPHTVVLKAGERVEGRLLIEGDTIKIIVAEGDPRDVPRAEVTDVNPDPEKTELDYWSFSGTLGATLLYGNTRTRTVGALAGLTREDDWTKLALGYTTTWGLDNDQKEIAKNHRGDAQFDVKITERFYVTPFVGHMLYDKFQNIRLRYRAGAGAGYFIIKGDDLSWQAEGGFAYSYTDRRSLVAGQKDKTYETNARVATRYHHKLTESITFDVSVESYIGTKYIKDTSHRVTGNLAFALAKGLALSVATIYDRIESPGKDTDGGRLKKNDLKVVIGLSVALP